MNPNNTATFEVVFSETIPYFDPEFGSVEMKFEGKAMAVPKDPSSFPFDNERATNLAKMYVTLGLQQAVIGVLKESYTVLSSRPGMFVQAIDAKLNETGMTLGAISFDSIAPTEDSQKHIDSMEKAKSLANNPSAMNAALQEANAQAQAQVQAQAAMAGSSAPAAAAADAPTAPVAPAAPAPAVPTAPVAPEVPAAPVLCKFCPACGHPASGTKFCTNCGKSLVRG